MSRVCGLRLRSGLVLAMSAGAALSCASSSREYTELPTEESHLVASSGANSEEPNDVSSDLEGESSVGTVTAEPSTPVAPGSPSSSVPPSPTPVPAVVLCGNGASDANEACDDGAANSDSMPNACRTDCTPARCGDGVQDGGEECDDGNAADNDACSHACKLSMCSDGVQQTGEACDDGNHVDDDGCSNACTLPGCGDGIQQEPEECDDGNAIDNDDCTNACKPAGCGDEIVQVGETCDDGNLVDDDACSNKCLVPGCGDGIAQANEECDDGMVTADCTAACKHPKCGDSFTQTGEECDDGNTVNNDSCTAACKRPKCGDGVLSSGESCEDANINNGDGCNSDCQLEVCGDGILSTGESCEDGNKVDGDGCSSMCQTEICGDTKKTGIEQCDDGNRNDNDGCSATCRTEVCGDGIVQTPREDCEDLNTVDTDICRNGCKNAASLNSLSSSCGNTDQITQTVCMVAVDNWCRQYNNDPIAGMVTGKIADNHYSVGCINGFTNKEAPTSQLDQCQPGRQQSPSCLEQIKNACVGMGYARGFYLGNGSSGNFAIACDNGSLKTESVTNCNGIADTSFVPVACSQALASKCGSNKGGMIQARAQSNQVTYTCIDLTLTGSARQF